MESEAVIDRRRRIENTFVEFTKLTPTIPMTEIDKMESLDGVRAEIRGRAESRKFRHIEFDGIREKSKFERRGMGPVGIQVYTGVFSGSAEHPENHEAVAMMSGELIIEKKEMGTIEIGRYRGPITYDELCYPSTQFSFGYSYVDGKDVPIVKITTIKSDFYQEFAQLNNGTHRAAKPLDQSCPSVVFIFKYQDGQPNQPILYRDHTM
jgi:hypothetical protein